MHNQPMALPGETEGSFARSFLIVLVTHVVLIAVAWTVGKFFFGATKPEPIVWLDGGGELGSAAPLEQPEASPPAPPAPEVPPPQPELPAPAPDTSDLALVPKPTPTPTPRPKPTPTATPRPKAPAPKPAPKVAAKVTPSPAKKAAPKAPKAKLATPQPGVKVTPPKITDTTGSNPGKAGPGAGDATHPGTKGGPGAPGGADSVLLGYFKKVEAQFRQEWQQPLTVVRSGRDVEAHVRLRARADGTVESLTLVKPTGNHEVDESIKQALRRVGKVEKPPAGLLKNGMLDELVAFILEL